MSFDICDVCILEKHVTRFYHMILLKFSWIERERDKENVIGGRFKPIKGEKHHLKGSRKSQP